MSNDNEIVIKKDKPTWESKGLVGRYAELCFSGLGSGAIVGGYIGATIGFTGALISPAVIGYGLVRGVRAIIRK